MFPKWHALYSFVFSIMLIHFFDFSLLSVSIIFLSSIFIDLDHALLYVLENKDLSPFRFWKYSVRKKSAWSNIKNLEKNNYKKPHFIFHGIEFILLLVILSFFHKFFSWILIGVLFHLSLDFIYLLYKKEGLLIKFSQIWLWQKNKNKKKFIFK